MVGMAEVEIDKETGSVELIDYVAVVDCGTPINPNLARVQTEGGIAQGIGMALFEDIQYTEKGAMANNSLMQYKIPSRLDVGKIRVEFKPSYEKSHPFGAKSIGEIVIDTRVRQLSMQFIMQWVSVWKRCRLSRKRLPWNFLTKSRKVCHFFDSFECIIIYVVLKLLLLKTE